MSGFGIIKSCTLVLYLIKFSDMQGTIILQIKKNMEIETKKQTVLNFAVVVFPAMVLVLFTLKQAELKITGFDLRSAEAP